MDTTGSHPRQVSLQDLIAGHEVLDLPWHAVELGSFAGNQLKPIGITKLFREEIRGERRYPDDFDLYANVYDKLIQRLSTYNDPPQKPDDLFFVRRIKVNMKTSEEDPFSPIYRFGDKYFEKIERSRDEIVKKYINGRRNPAPKKLPFGPRRLRRPTMYLHSPAESGLRLQMETSPQARPLLYAMETPTELGPSMHMGTYSNVGSSYGNTNPAPIPTSYMDSLRQTQTIYSQPIPEPPSHLDEFSPFRPTLAMLTPPPCELPVLHAISPAISEPPLHPYLADFLFARRHDFEDFCREQERLDFRQRHATRTFEALRTGADRTIGDMNDEAMVHDDSQLHTTSPVLDSDR